MKKIIVIILVAGFLITLLSHQYFSMWRPYYGGYKLVRAAGKGHLIEVKFILAAGVDINFMTSKGGTALGEAGLSGHLDIVKYLLRKGADARIDGRVISVGADKTGPNEAIKLIRSKVKSGERYLHQDFTPDR